MLFPILLLPFSLKLILIRHFPQCSIETVPTKVTSNLHVAAPGVYFSGLPFQDLLVAFDTSITYRSFLCLDAFIQVASGGPCPLGFLAAFAASPSQLPCWFFSFSDPFGLRHPKASLLSCIYTHSLGKLTCSYDYKVHPCADDFQISTCSPNLSFELLTQTPSYLVDITTCMANGYLKLSMFETDHLIFPLQPATLYAFLIQVSKYFILAVAQATKPGVILESSFLLYPYPTFLFCFQNIPQI